MANNCFYCSKEISEDIILCSFCESFILMLKDEGIINNVDKYFKNLKNGIHWPKFDQVIRFILSRDWSCERCGYTFNREILDLLKLAKNSQITEEQEKDCFNMLICPKCSFRSSKMWEYYSKIIIPNTIRYHGYREKAREDRRKSFEKWWKAYYEKTSTDVMKNQNGFIFYLNKFNPLKEPMEIDSYSILLKYDSFRTRKLEWIDYFGIIIRKSQQIYSNIEQGYLNDQNKLDRVAESFVSGTLYEKLSQIYSPYLKKYEPNVYSRYKDEILYIIIGNFRSNQRVKLILNKLEIFIENLKFKKIVDVENFDKSGIVMVQYLMEIFIFVIKCYFLAKNRKEKKLLWSKLTNFIYILDNDFIYWPK